MFNPETNSSEPSRNGQFITPEQNPDGLSYQEAADLDQARSFRNTAEHLGRRARGTSEHSVGVSPDDGAPMAVAKAEAQLMEIQQQLYNCSDFIQQAVLQAKAEEIAAFLTGGPAQAAQAPQKVLQEPEVNEGQQYAEERAAVDDALVEALNNASTMLAEEQIHRVNDLLGDSDPEVVALASDTITQVTPSMVAAPDVVGGELDDNTYSFIADIAGDEVANDAAVLTAALASGKVSRSDALRTAMHSRPLMNALLAAAANDELPFTLAL